MRKLYLLSLSATILTASGILFSSCKDDDEPPAKPKLSFTETTLDVNEADGTIEVEVTLDKPADKDLTIEYTLAGSAQDEETETDETPFADYRIASEHGEIEIEQGETTGIIEIVLFSDIEVEDPETIEISITEVDETLELTENSKTTLTVGQEDGILVVLSWPETSTAGTADMDLLVRIGQTADSPEWDGILTGSAFRGFQRNFEFVFLPASFSGDLFGLGYTDTSFGLSYTYYDGTLDPLEYEVAIIEFKDGDFEPDGEEQIFTQTYTKDNINKWTDAAPPTIIAQRIRLNDGLFSDITEITKEVTSSRTILRDTKFLNDHRLMKGSLRMSSLSQLLKNRLNL